jgi:hypothetical protein
MNDAMSKKSADWQKVRTSAIIRAAARTGLEGWERI